MIADLHAHYAMHLVPGTRGGLWHLLRSRRGRLRLREWVRAVLVGLAGLVLNYRSPFSGARVRMKYLRRGGVGVVLSVLYSFFDEVDVGHGTRPQPGYLETLEDQLDLVERRVRKRHGKTAAVVRNPAELETAIAAGKVAFVHCVEGGFQLGAEPRQVERAVRTLAHRGVAYVTLAHLIWREVATDAPALPFMSDETYRRWFPQPEVGLSDLGRAAVRAMVSERVLIDVSHMSERALDETLTLLDELDPDRRVPVLATHTGCRLLGKQEYLLRPETLARIAERDGVIGLIFAQHQICDGITPAERRALRLPGSRRRRFTRSFRVLRQHIDCIHEATGSHRHTAIGSDLDGFIKPTLPALEDMRDMARLERALRDCYGDGDGELICSGNARRVLTSYWRGRP